MNDLQQWLKDNPYVGPFRPHPHYSEVGDTIFVYLTDARCYAETVVPGVLDVYKDMETHAVVGVKIMGASSLVRPPCPKATTVGE